MKKINFSVISLVTVLLLFGTATYAWLSMSMINNLENITITATAGNELELSLDGEVYEGSLPHVVMEQLLRQVKLDDVTSYDGISFQRGGIRSPGQAIRNIDYLSFDIYFRTTRPEHYVYLVNNVNHRVQYDTSVPGTFVVSRGVSWSPRYDFQNGLSDEEVFKAGQQAMFYASDAVRISAVEQINDRNPLDVRLSDNLARMIYDPSENEYRGFGQTFGAFHYFELMTGNRLIPPHSKPNTIYQLTEFHELNPYMALDDRSLIATLQPSSMTDDRGRPYFTGKVRINIWVEGWDPDTFDCILQDRLKIQLQFKVAQRAQ
jgi:hypothetical protein